MSERYVDLAERLDSIAADLDERAFDQLREAQAAGAGRPVDDKALMQARRAIEKAATILRRLDAPSS